MNDRPPLPLNYSPPPEPDGWPAWAMLAALFIWPFIVLHIWCGAIIGPLMLALGLSNLVHPLDGTWLHGRRMLTYSQQMHWIIVSALMSAAYILLARWHLKWRRTRAAQIPMPRCRSRCR